jgi:cell division protein FtsL
MLSLRLLINLVCVVALATGLYLVKYSVQDVQREADSLKRELAKEQESLHLLNAEWAYLNRPERLRELADRHLELAPMDSARINQTAVLPAAVPAQQTIEDSSLVRSISLQGEAR